MSEHVLIPFLLDALLVGDKSLRLRRYPYFYFVCIVGNTVRTAPKIELGY